MAQQLKSSYLRRQSYFLAAAAVVHVVGQLAFYLIWPILYLSETISRDRMPGYPHGLILFTILGLLNLLEGYILYVTIKVMSIKSKKADVAGERKRKSLLEFKSQGLEQDSIELGRMSDVDRAIAASNA